MTWIVLKEENGKIKLVSKDGTDGMISKGAYLTIEEKTCKFILRVDESGQTEPFEPSPLIVDMDISGIAADRQCKNIVRAYRVKTIDESDDDDLVRYIRPLSVARRSTQEEIDDAMDSGKSGPKVFVATVFANENRILRDDNKKYITACLPEEFYYHQTMICGKTGSGKTVAMKYLAQYFAEEMNGAVLAINVKGDDFLRMDQPSVPREDSKTAIEKEWKSMDRVAHGVKKFTIYHPANSEPKRYNSLSANLTKITLNMSEIEPEALTGVLGNITDKAAESLPGIFRYWRETQHEKRKPVTYIEFERYFSNNSSDRENRRTFGSRNERGDNTDVTLHAGTYQSVLTSISNAAIFFDNSNSTMLKHDDILVEGKISVIDVSEKGGTLFGSLVLRDLLKRLVEAKEDSLVKLLIIIDEVHQFYNTGSARKSLDDLDTICRTGRHKEIGVFFASQNPADMPSGLSSVVNTKIFFKTDIQSVKEIGIKVSSDELDGLKKGYAVASIHDLPQLRVVKFPLSFGGVIDVKH